MKQEVNPTSFARLTLNFEYDLSPKHENYIRVQKILLFLVHELQEEGLLTWEDTPLKDIKTRVRAIKDVRKNPKVTFGHVVIDMEYDLPSTWFNLLDINKILNIAAHIVRRDNMGTWDGVKLKSYDSRVGLRQDFDRTKNRTSTKQDNKRGHKPRRKQHTKSGVKR